MTAMTFTGGDLSLLIIAIAFFGLSFFLCFVLINTMRVLESTRITIDEFRQETVPLLREVKGTVERTNRELDRVDTMLVSATAIVGRAEKLSGLVEQAAGNPLVKIISVGAGLRKGFGKAKGGSKGGRKK